MENADITNLSNLDPLLLLLHNKSSCKQKTRSCYTRQETDCTDLPINRTTTVKKTKPYRLVKQIKFLRLQVAEACRIHPKKQTKM